MTSTPSPPPIRILLVGLAYDPADPSSIGGIATLAHYLLLDLRSRPGVRVFAADLSASRCKGARLLVRCLRDFLLVLWRARQCDVLTLHVGPTSLHLSGPAMVLIGRLLRKPVIIRQSAGNHYREFAGWRGRMIEWAARRAAVYLVETRRILDLARADGLAQVRWFPNYRPPAPRTPGGRAPRARRFVFVSRVTPTKGVAELIEASEGLPADASVHFYGPFEEGLGEALFAGRSRASYHGCIPPGEVLRRLADYDVLVLPTYYPMEGYPGILMEAFSVGLPVICTRWMCLEEVANDSCAILIPPRDPAALRQAMLRLADDPELYTRLCQGASRRAGDFSSSLWAETFLEYCRAVSAPKPWTLP